MTDYLEEELILKHKRERKDLQAEIQKLKHAVPKGDKKKKKEVQVQIAQLEADLDARHKAELDALHAAPTKPNDATDAVEAAAAQLESMTTDSEMTNKSKKPSKAQRRRDKKDQQAKEREERIKEQEEINVHGPRNREEQTLKEKLKQKSLALYEIPSDGNCLYAALCHQLERRDVPTSVASLRKQSADHMRGHPGDFLPFLSQQDTGDPFTEEEFEKYLSDMEHSPAWGGQLEIRALSNVLHMPIEVLQADGPTMLLGQEYPDETLILTYHRHMYGLGEHYNSVIPLSEVPEEDEFS